MLLTITDTQLDLNNPAEVQMQQEDIDLHSYALSLFRCNEFMQCAYTISTYTSE